MKKYLLFPTLSTLKSVVVVVLCCVSFFLAMLLREEMRDNSSLVQRLDVADSYINLLEVDAGDVYMMDVAAETDEYFNYHNN